MQSSSYIQPTPNYLAWYQHHITPNWLFCEVNELEDFSDDGMIISRDLCESKLSRHAIEFPMEGKIQIQTISPKQEIWLNYIAAEILHEKGISQREKDHLCEQFLFHLMPNLKITHWLSDTGVFYIETAVQDILDDHVHGQILLPNHLLEELRISQGDMVILRMDHYEKGNIEKIQKLKNSCLWI